MHWEHEVRYNLARRRSEGLAPQQEIRKLKRWAHFWCVLAVLGWAAAALLWSAR